VIVELGNVAPGGTVTLAVPANTLGFNIIVESETDPDAFVGIERITSPSGEVVHDDFTPKGGSHATSKSSVGAIATVSVPQSEARAANRPEPGRWAIRIGGGAPDGGSASHAGSPDGRAATFHVEAHIQIGHAEGFVGGRLDLRVFVPTGLQLDGASLNSMNAGTSPGIARRLDAFFDALQAQLGIDRGDVTFLPAKGELHYLDSEELLREAFSAPTGHPDEQSLSVTLTNGIALGADAAWGIAPGIPGAAARSGTPMSAIVLAIGDTPAIGDGLALLHEAGHFFGLNHTTEFGTGLADPLADTPKCAALAIEEPSTIDNCPDRLNLMFPAFYNTVGTNTVTEAQRAIYRGSPIYKAYKEPLPAATASTRAHTLGILPGERVTLTKSGRALTGVESSLSASLCGHPSHNALEPDKLAQANGRAATIIALRSAAADPDLPTVMQRKAAGALQKLGVSVR
jgi:hypothetical protein